MAYADKYLSQTRRGIKRLSMVDPIHPRESDLEKTLPRRDNAQLKREFSNVDPSAAYKPRQDNGTSYGGKVTAGHSTPEELKVWKLFGERVASEVAARELGSWEQWSRPFDDYETQDGGISLTSIVRIEAQAKQQRSVASHGASITYVVMNRDHNGDGAQPAHNGHNGASNVAFYGRQEEQTLKTSPSHYSNSHHPQHMPASKASTGYVPKPDGKGITAAIIRAATPPTRF